MRPNRCLVADAHLDWRMHHADVEEISRITNLQGQALDDLISELEPAIDFARAMHAVDYRAPDRSGHITVALQGLIAKLEPAVAFARTFSATDGTPEENMRVNAALQALVTRLEPAVKSKHFIPVTKGPKSSESARNFHKRETLASLITWLQGHTLQRLITSLRGPARLEGLIDSLEAAIEFARTVEIGEVKSPLLRDISRALRPVQRALDKGKPPHKVQEVLLRQDERNPSLGLWGRIIPGNLAANVARHFQPKPESQRPSEHPFSLGEHSLIHDVRAALIAAGVERISNYDNGPLAKVLKLCSRLAGIRRVENSKSICQHLKRYRPSVRGNQP